MKRTKRLIRKAGFTLRVLLIFTTLSAFFTLWIWAVRAELVERIDSSVFTAYTGYYTAKYDHARALLMESKVEEAEKVLTDLLADMGTVRKRDRLAPAYSAVLEALISINDEKGDYVRALEFAGRLVELDPNYYPGWLKYAVQMEKNGDVKGAISAIFKAYGIAPHSLEVTKHLAELLYRGSRKSEIGGFVNGYLEANRGGNLALFYATGGGELKPKAEAFLPSVSYKPGVRSFRLPVGSRGVTTLLVNFQHLMDMNVRIRSLRFITPAEKIDSKLGDYGMGASDMMKTGITTFTTTGPMPAMFFTLPPVVSEKELMAIEFTAEFWPQFPERLRYLAEGDG